MKKSRKQFLLAVLTIVVVFGLPAVALADFEFQKVEHLYFEENIDIGVLSIPTSAMVLEGESGAMGDGNYYTVQEFLNSFQGAGMDQHLKDFELVGQFTNNQTYPVKVDVYIKFSNGPAGGSATEPLGSALIEKKIYFGSTYI